MWSRKFNYCIKCGTTTVKHYAKGLCEDCYYKFVDSKRYWKRKEYFKTHNKEYYQRPEVKIKMKEYYQRPEIKVKQKEYQQRSEVKAKQKRYYNRPDIRIKQKGYRKIYRQRPDVKAKEKIRKRKNNKRSRIKAKLPKKCYICGFKEVLDIHHIKYSKNRIQRGKRRGDDLAMCRLKDYLVLCPNHHAMIHRLGYTIEELKNITKQGQIPHSKQ